MIDRAFSQGGGTVLIPPRVFLTGGLALRSRVRLHLQAGAVFVAALMSRNPGPPVEGDANRRHLLFAIDAEEIAVRGRHDRWQWQWSGILAP